MKRMLLTSVCCAWLSGACARPLPEVQHPVGPVQAPSPAPAPAPPPSAPEPPPAPAPAPQDRPGYHPTAAQVVSAMSVIEEQVAGCLHHLPRGPITFCFAFQSNGTVASVGTLAAQECGPFTEAFLSDARNACLEPLLKSVELPDFEAETFRVAFPFMVGS